MNQSKMGRPVKWGEKKKTHNISLTDTAWVWLKAHGGLDYLESLARDSKPPAPLRPSAARPA